MRRLRTLAVLGALALGGVWLFREPLLNAIFDFLVTAEPPSKADIAVVLGGDYHGRRLLTAAQLVRDGFVPVVLVDGPGGYYDRFECDAAIPFAIQHGYPESYFQHFHGTFTSTAEEAAAVIPELRKRNIKKALVVSSAYHTRRLSRYFNHLDGLEVHTVAAPDQYANHGDWWKTRDGRKTIYLEWSKTIATWLGV